MIEFNRFKVEGFRRLHRVDLEMRPIMALIGANGIGKTSFLDALSLLAASAAGRLNQELSRLGGLANLLTREKADALSFQAEFALPGIEPMDYTLVLRPQGGGHVIEREILTQARPGAAGEPLRHIDSSPARIQYCDIKKGGTVAPEWPHDPLETSLAQVPRIFREPEELRRTSSSVVHYHLLDVGSKAPIRLPQQMIPTDLPGLSGEKLVPFLYSTRENDPDRFESILDTLIAAFPDLEALAFPPVAAGMLTMTWKSALFPRPFFLNELSEGILRFLWLCSLLHAPSPPILTMIDEPEVSLHPELLHLLTGLLREASLRTQVIVATHSERLVRFLQPHEVAVMDAAEDGQVSIKWGDSFEIEGWLANYGLDEVWRMGRMGGRA